MLSSEESGRLVTVRMLPPGSAAHGVLVDLLFQTSGIEREVVSHATALDLPGLGPQPVARVGHLLASRSVIG